ncbi:MAG: hypothetical protein AMXMBFR7_20910 [Planctomycetota bacterium]
MINHVLESGRGAAEPPAPQAGDPERPARMPRARFATVFLLTLSVLLAGDAAWAATIAWSGAGANANWSTAANWVGGQVPASGDSVTFSNNNRSVVVNVPVNLAALTMSNYLGTMTLNNHVTVTGNWVVNGSTTPGFALAGTGTNTISVGGNFTLGVNGVMRMLSGNVLIGGTTTLGSNNSLFTISSGTFISVGDFTVDNNSDMIINGGLVRTDGTFYLQQNAEVFLNAGTLSIGEVLVQGNSKSIIHMNGGTLPVSITSLEARADAGGILVEWRVASEIENLGFHLWRRTCDPNAAGQEERALPQAVLFEDEGLARSGWERVTEQPVAGRLSNPAPRTYRWLDLAPPGTYVYALETIGLDGKRERFAQASPQVTRNAEDTASATAEGLDAWMDRIERGFRSYQGDRALTRLAAARETLSRARISDLAIPRTNAHETQEAAYEEPDLAPAVSARAVAQTVTDLPAYASEPFGGRFVPPSNRPKDVAKAVTQGRGVVLIPPASLPLGYSAEHLRVWYEGRPYRPLALDADTGALALYATGYTDAYTERDAFFLEAIAGRTSTGKVLQARGLFQSAQTPATVADGHAELEFHEVYFQFNRKPRTFRPYFSNKFLTGGSTHSFALATPHATAAAATLSVVVYSQSFDDDADPDHELQVTLNGTPLGVAQWEGAERMLRLTWEIPAGLLNESTPNTVELVTPVLAGVETQLSFLYGIEIDYRKALLGPGPVAITGGVNGLVELRGFTTGQLWVVDARVPAKPKLVPYEAVEQLDGSFHARFVAQPTGKGDGYLVVPSGAESAPVALSTARLEPLPKGLKYLAVGPQAFAASVAPLIERRNQEGLVASFVDQQRLFDTYGYGRFGPAGIYRAAASNRGSLRFLCLVGRTTHDYRDRVAPAGIDPLCPTVLSSSSSFAELPADSRYGDFGRGPQLAVGRFPVNTSAELDVAVQRTLDFTPMQGDSGGQGLLVADRNDAEAGHFELGCEQIQNAAPALNWDKVYLGITHSTAAEVTTAMQTAANGGTDLIVFVGHGASSQLSKENVLNAAKAAAWTGNCVLVTATCTFNYFLHDEAILATLAEQLLTQAQGGIAASIGSSGYTTPHALIQFDRAFFREVRPGRTWGEALQRAQAEVWKQGQLLQRKGDPEAAAIFDQAYGQCLLGDPALPIAAP